MGPDLTKKPVLTISAWQCLFDEALTFDTSVRTLRLSCVIREAKVQGQQISYDVAANAYDKAAAVFEQRYLAARPITNDERMQILLAALSLPDDASSVRRLRRSLEETHSAIGMEVLPGALDFLSEFSDQFRLVLLSDTWMTPGWAIDQFLDKAGLCCFFDRRIYSDAIGHHKVDGSAFLHVAKTLSVPLFSMIHVGDLWQSDVLGAVEAGVRRIFYLDSPMHPVPDNRSRKGVQPGQVVVGNSLVEIAGLLRKHVKSPEQVGAHAAHQGQDRERQLSDPLGRQDLRPRIDA